MGCLDTCVKQGEVSVVIKAFVCFVFIPINQSIDLAFLKLPCTESVFGLKGLLFVWHHLAGRAH